MPSLIRTRFLVIGSGVAGLHTAWRGAEHGEVLVLTKRSLFDSATAYAQGGIAAAFALGSDGKLKRGREAAHSRRRIVHANGDRTGAEVARTLVERVQMSRKTSVLEFARVLELIVENGRCAGVRASVSGQGVEIR